MVGGFFFFFQKIFYYFFFSPRFRVGWRPFLPRTSEFRHDFHVRPERHRHERRDDQLDSISYVIFHSFRRFFSVQCQRDTHRRRSSGSTDLTTENVCSAVGLRTTGSGEVPTQPVHYVACRTLFAEPRVSARCTVPCLGARYTRIGFFFPNISIVPASSARDG